MKLKLLVIFCNFFISFPSLASAADVELRSGRIISGEIVEKTDSYIKIQSTSGNSYKIPFKELLDPNEFVGKMAESATAVVENFPASSWEEWYPTAQPYVIPAEKIMLDILKSLKDSNITFSFTFQLQGGGEMVNQVKVAVAQVNEYIFQLNQLQPPEEFKKFHAKLTWLSKAILEIYGSLLMNDPDTFYLCQKKINRFTVACLEEFQELLKRHKAPYEVLEATNQKIDFFKKFTAFSNIRWKELK